MKYKIILSIFLALYIAYLLSNKITTSETTNNQLNYIAKEKEFLMKAKMLDATSLFNQEMSMTDYIPVDDINLDLSKEDIKKYPQFSLRIAILLHYFDKRTESVTIVKQVKLHSKNQIYQHIATELTELYSNEKITKTNIKAEDLNFFSDPWYKYQVLSQVYSKMGKPTQLQEIKTQSSSIAMRFYILNATMTILLFGGFVAGIVFLYLWLKAYFGRTENIKLSFEFNKLINPGYEAIVFFLIWLSISLSLNFLFSKIFKDQISKEWLIAFALLVQILMTLLTIALIQLYILSKERISIKDFINKCFSPSTKSAILYGIKGYFIAIPIVMVIALINKLFFDAHPIKSNPVFSYLLGDTPTYNIIFIIAMASLVAPFIEELLFRGILFKLFSKRWGYLSGALISSLLFGIVHFNLMSLIPIISLGLILSWVYYKSDSLLAPMITHGLWNSVTLITVLLIYR